MSEHRNTSVDTVREDTLSPAEDALQTNGETSASSSIRNGGPVYPRPVSSPSTTPEGDDLVHSREPSNSVSPIDTDVSQRYVITSAQARTRALKAIRRARKRNPVLSEEDD